MSSFESFGEGLPQLSATVSEVVAREPQPQSVRGLLPAVLAAGLVLSACGGGQEHDLGVAKATMDDEKNTVVELEEGFSAAEADEYTPDLYIDGYDLGLPGADEDALLPLYKQYDREYSGSDDYIPLVTARVEGEGLVLRDESPEGVEEDVTNWLGERIMQNPLAIEMLKKGGIITFALDDDAYASPESVQDIDGVFGHYVHENKELVFEISTQVHTLSADVMDQYLSHEAAHMLFAADGSSVFNETTKPTEAQLSKFRQVCGALRDKVLEGVRGRTFSIERYLSQYVELEDDPNGAARYELLIDAFRGGSWTELVPTRAEPMYEDEKEVVECTVSGLGFMQRFVGDSRGLPEPRPYDAEKDEFDEDAHMAFSDAQSEFYELLREESLYSVLTEGTYVREAPLMGHPSDGLDEMAASTINILVSYPEELARNLRYLPEGEQAVVIDMIRLVADTVSERHPDVSGYLADREAVFLEELHS